ncbi:MAG: transposase [Planctomycetota bacterium]
MRRRHTLTDEPWERIKGHLPGKADDPGRTAVGHRRFVHAVIYQLKTGIAWEDLPTRLGQPNRVWKRFDRGCVKGMWERVAKALGDGDLVEALEQLPLDSTSIKAHPTASTGRRLAEAKKTTPIRVDVEAAHAAGGRPSCTRRWTATAGCDGWC